MKQRAVRLTEDEVLWVSVQGFRKMLLERFHKNFFDRYYRDACSRLGRFELLAPQTTLNSHFLTVEVNVLPLKGKKLAGG